LIKPPKFGNCRIQDISEKIVIEDFDLIFSHHKSIKSNNLHNVYVKLANLVETKDYECEDIFPLQHNYASAIYTDCIIFYVSGFLCRKMKNLTNCNYCKKAYESCTKNIHLPDADLVNERNRGGLIYVNSYLYNLFKTTESYFQHHIQNKKLNIYEATIQDVIENFNLSFPCDLHKEQAVAECLHYYVTMRMRQWAKIQSNDLVKISKQKKKEARLSKN